MAESAFFENDLGASGSVLPMGAVPPREPLTVSENGSLMLDRSGSSPEAPRGWKTLRAAGEGFGYGRLVPRTAALASLFALLGSACTEDAGRFSVVFRFASGVSPPPPGAYEIVASLRYPTGTEVAADDVPVPFPPSAPLAFSAAPYGEDLVVEVGLFSGGAASGLPAYFGRSRPFDLGAGADLTVEVEIDLRPAPSEPPVVLAVNGRDPSDVVTTRVPRALVLVEARGADRFELARDPRFVVDLETFDAAATATAAPGRFLLDYDLTGACQEGGCEGLQTVFLRARADRFASDPVPIRVAFDTRAPSLLDLRFSPSVARPGDRPFLQVVTSEPLAEDEAGAPRLGLAWVGRAPTLSTPTRDGTLYGFQVEVPDAVEGLPAAFQLSALTLRDAAGNEATVTATQALRLDATPPVIRCASGAAPCIDASATRVRPGDAVEVRFVLEEPPAAASLDLENRNLPCAIVAGQNVCPFVAEARDGPALREVARVLALRVEDVAGNRTTVQRTLVVDRAPPDVVPGSASRQLVGAATNLLPDGELMAAGTGTRVRVTFTVTEALAVDPVLEAVRGSVVIEIAGPAEAAPPFYSFFGSLEEDADDGAYALRARLVDAVGNAATVSLGDLEVLVDRAPPPAPDVETAGRVVLYRAPWGAQATGGQPRLELRGAPGAAPASSTLVVFRPGAAGELARVRADSRGAFGPARLAAFDEVSVDLLALDAAGNPSPRVTVREGRWAATLFGKVPGTRTPNPHRLGVTVAARRALVAPEGDLGRLASQAEIDAATSSSAPGGALEVNAAALFRELDLGSSVRDLLPAADIGVGQVLATDLRRGRVVSHAPEGNPTLSTQSPTDWTLERAGGRFARISLSGGLGPGATRAPLVYDARRGQTVRVGDPLWTWNGRSWSSVRPATATRPTGRVLYDGARGRVTTISTNEIFVWDGAAWTSIPTSGVDVPDGPVAYDPSRGVVVKKEAGGTGTFELSGTVWTRASAAAPAGSSARDATLAFDPGLSEIVALLGETGETYSYDGARWVRRAGAPPGFDRFGTSVALVLDPTLDRLVHYPSRFTGTPGTFSGPSVFNGAEWVELSSPEEAGTVGHDSATGESFLLSGGALYRWLRGGWAVDPRPGPPGLTGEAVFVYDPRRAALQLFSSLGQSELIATGFSLRRASSALPIGTPIVYPGGMGFFSVLRSPRGILVTEIGANASTSTPIPFLSNGVAEDMVFGFAPSGGRVVAFGGFSAPLTRSDLYERIAASSWQEVTQSGPIPRDRRFAVTVHDTDRARMLLFGGESEANFGTGVPNVTPLTDTWVLGSSGWVPLPPTDEPPESRVARGAHAYDAASHRWILRDEVSTFVLGEEGGTAPAVLFAVDVAAAGVPFEALEEVRARVVAGGDGHPGSGVVLEVWDAWDGSWRTFGTGPAPAGRPDLVEGHTASPADARRLVLEDLGEIRFRVRTAGTDARPAGATVVVDAVEARVSYRL